MRSLLFLLVLAAGGCSSNDSTAQTPPSPTSSTTATSTTANGQVASATTQDPTTPVATDQKKDVPVDQLVNADGKIDEGLPKTAAPGAKLPKAGDDIAILTTNRGTIYVKFFPEKAPNHVKNFLTLAKKGFYDGTKFHRIIPKFMIQGGDPNTKSGDPSTWGQGGPGYNVNAEFNDIPHTRGILSMARTGDPNGAGSQFFVMHERYPSLDGQYSVFGQVIKGMDVVDKIVMTPRNDQDRPDTDQVLKKVEVKKWPVDLKD